MSIAVLKEDLPFWVEKQSPGEPLELVSISKDMTVSFAAYDATVELYPGAYVVLRQRARIMRKTGEQP